MKVLFVTTRLFWPADSGRKVSLFYYCKGLHEKCGCEVHLFSFLESGQSPEQVADKPDFISSVTLAEPIKKFTKLKNLFSKSVFIGWPFQCSLYYSRKNNKKLLKLCEELNPDIVIVDMIRLAPYFKAFKKRDCLKILDLDDLLSERYLRQASNVEGKADILGNYSDNVSKSNKKLLKKPFIKRFALKSESKRVKKAEIKYGKLYEKTVFVSEKETEEFNKRCGFNKAYTVRLGVDYDYYAADIELDKKNNELIFMGNLKVAANIDSLDMIIRNVLPLLDFDYTFHVIGSVSDELKNNYSDERIVFHGRVDDVRPLIKSSKVFLSPIAYGTGIKTKILEAMAMGSLVVTNSVGAEGIDAINDVHFYVRDTYAEIANTVNKLIHESDVQVGSNAQALIHEKYSWNEIYKDLYAVVIGDKKNENNMDNA